MPNLANVEKPTEDQEQEVFVQWLRPKGYPHGHRMKHTPSRGARKLRVKKLGVSSGVPDLFVVVPFACHLIIGS